MAKKVGQIRFYSNGSTQNYPGDNKITTQTLLHGAAFKNYYPIIQLGVQTLPGTRMYINGFTTPVIVGSTGIYELSVDGLSSITDLQFDRTSLNTIANNDNAYLLIDFVYEQGD